jgi:hypothetical protein
MALPGLPRDVFVHRLLPLVCWQDRLALIASCVSRDWCAWTRASATSKIDGLALQVSLVDSDGAPTNDRTLLLAINETSFAGDQHLCFQPPADAPPIELRQPGARDDPNLSDEEETDRGRWIECDYILSMARQAGMEYGSIRVTNQNMDKNKLDPSAMHTSPCKRFRFRLELLAPDAITLVLIAARVSLHDLTLLWTLPVDAARWFTYVVMRTQEQRAAWSAALAWYQRIGRRPEHTTPDEMHTLAVQDVCDATFFRLHTDLGEREFLAAADSDHLDTPSSRKRKHWTLHASTEPHQRRKIDALHAALVTHASNPALVAQARNMLDRQ